MGRNNRGVEKIHNEKLNDLYSSPNTIRVIMSRIMRWAGHVVLWGEERCIEVTVGKPKRKIPLGRHRRRRKDNIKMDLQEIRWGHRLD